MAATLTTTCRPQSSHFSTSLHPQRCEKRTLLPLRCLPHITRVPPTSICEPEGKDTCNQRVSNVATESKGLHVCYSAGCRHLFPLSALLVSSQSPPPDPPRSLQEMHCLCFLSCVPLPKLWNQFSTNKKKRTSCSFVHCAGQGCCLTHHFHIYILTLHNRRKDLFLSIRLKTERCPYLILQTEADLNWACSLDLGHSFILCEFP